MNRIERYLGMTVVSHTLLVLMVLISLLGFSEFISEIDRVNENYTTWQVASYVLLRLPNYAYQLFPVALLIGALIGLGGLANRSELTILRVSGWSISRIFTSIVKIALLFWVVMAVVGEQLGTSMEAYANKMRAEALNQSFSLGKQSAFWVNNQQRYIQVGAALANDDLRDVNLYHMVNGRLQKRQSFDRVKFVEGRWRGLVEQQTALTLLDAQTLQLDSERQRPVRWMDVRSSVQQDQVVDLPFLPEDLDKLTIKEKSLNLWQLQQQIDFLKENGGDIRRLEVAYWNKIATPLVVLAMIAIVFPLIFGSQRQVSMGQRVFVGVLIGLLFHLANQLIGNLGVIYQISAAVTAFLPAGMLLVVALLWLKLQK